MNKGHAPTHQRAAHEYVGVSEGPRHTTGSIIPHSGAQANDVQSECPASTSDGNQKTPDERDP